MLSLFKKTVLSVAMLGCAFGAQAEDKKSQFSSTAKKALASAGLVAGGALLSGGRIIVPQISIVAGSALTVTAGLYLLCSARDMKAKIKSLCGSFNLLLAGTPLFIAGGAFAEFMHGKDTLQVVGVASALAALLGAGGYLLQPEDIDQDNKV